MTATIRAIHGINERRVAEDPQQEPVVIPEAEALATAAPAPIKPHPAPKHRRPSRFQRWWRPQTVAPTLEPTVHHAAVSEPQQPADITRSLIELTDERFQALTLRLETLTDEVIGLTRALDGLERYLKTDRAGEIDRSRWLLGEKLATLIERLEWD
jgi:hypothetical protein